MVSKNKLIMYVGFGAVTLIVGYFIYKQVVSSAATKSIKSMIGGLGQGAISQIGATAGNLPFISKSESLNQPITPASPIPAHRANVRAIPSPSSNLAKTTVSQTVGTGRTTPATQPTSYPKPLSGRGIIGGVNRPFPTSKPTARTSAKPRLSRPTRSRTRPRSITPITHGGTSRSMYGRSAR